MSESKKKAGIYVAGRMRGVPFYGFPAFDKARDRLAALGLTPLSPADMDRAAGFDPTNWCADAQLAAIASDWKHVPDTFDLAAAIARDNAAIDDPGTVALYVIHEGISESAGGMAEIERGMKGGKVILYDTMSDEAILWALGIYPQKPRLAELHVAHKSLSESLLDRLPSIREQMMNVIWGNANAARTFFTDPATGGRKETKLARHDLLPPDIVHELAEHYGKGARKYGERNMEKGYPWSKTYAACHRHLNSFWQGEDVDAETGSLHLVAAAWHCFTMAWFLRHNAGTDDRPVTGKKGDTRE